MRALVVMAVLSGFLPSFRAEALTSARSVPGAANVSAPAHGDGQSDSEHGCDVTLHLCGCCASQPLMVRVAVPLPVELASVAGLAIGDVRRPAYRVPEPPFRPPIR